MATDMFIRIATLEGESADDAHRGAIEVLAWNWGLSNDGTPGPGSGRSRAGKVRVQDLSFTKYVDRATPGLLLAVCTGKRVPDAELTVRRPGDQPFDYLRLKLGDVLVSAVTCGGAGDADRLTETVTLGFTRFEVSYQAQNEDGSLDAEVEAGWDIARGSRL